MPTVSLPVLPSTSLRLTPTDITQFVRLEQCERFLRLKLAERSGHDFLEEYGVSAQRITPLMTLSGSRFEQSVETKLAANFRTIHFSNLAGGSHSRLANNPDVIREAIQLPVGESVVLLQTRLDADLAGWRLRGDVDLIKLTRNSENQLDVLVADLKSTAKVKVEHRLQVAFYHLMLASILGIEKDLRVSYRTGVLYRPPINPTAQEEYDVAPQRIAAQTEFQLEEFLFEIVADPQAYVRSVHDLVLNEDSTARRVARSELAELPYSLSFKCDGCLFTEYCMKASAETEDLSLLPYLNVTEKEALRRGGIQTIQDLATLKQFAVSGEPDLIPTPGREAQIKQLSATWPIGPRMDELIHRAKSFRKSVKKDGTVALGYIPDKGNSSLPVTKPDLNPNLIWLYLDAQHDPLEGRVYLLGALAVACREGVPVERRSIVHFTDGPPNSAARERNLFVNWTTELLKSVLEIAQSSDSNQESKSAPIHIVFFNRYEQRLLLEGLARNFPAMLEQTPPLYDFLTQLAAFDSPLASFLDEEVRTFRNFPMTCQSLQSVASYLRFDWTTPHHYRELFRARLFDYLGQLDIDGVSEWYTRRSRFSSSIPTEYAYAAWGQLPVPAVNRQDEFADFRPVTRDLLLAFQSRRLEALEHITNRMQGNPYTQKTAFNLPEIVGYEDKAHDLAHALDEFIRIERMVTLADWKGTRHTQPEQRVLGGECLLVRYCEEDQEPGTAEQNRENERRRLKREEYTAAFRAANPGKRLSLPKDQVAECKWSPEGLKLKLRIETHGVDCDLHELLLLSTLREGTQVILFSRLTVDERKPEADREEFTPTPKQMLYGQRAELIRVTATETDSTGRAKAAIAEVELLESRGNEHTTPFVFGAFNRPLINDRVYTLDPCPNEWYSYWCSKVVEGLCEGEPHVLYRWLVTMPEVGDGAGAAGQMQFLAGLDSFGDTGHLHDFEAAKRAYIGAHSKTPVLLVQGPPGTGKSYSTAFAVFARVQQAMSEGRDYRVFLSCKTHAATDVLLANVLEVQEKLRKLREIDPVRFDAHFDSRLLDIPLYRVAPKDEPPAGITALGKDSEKESGEDKNVDVLTGTPYAILGITPGGTYGMLKKKWPRKIFGHELCDLLVLDEASQMNIPEALMAALPLKPTGHVVVVGDHRQMPPIVKHDWDNETRRTFHQYQAFRSLFDTLRHHEAAPPMIQFSESFRLHGSMAAFLKKEIYQHDGIDYHSHRRDLLASHPHSDPFLAAVLDPAYPLIVVVHDEASSQVRNPFEQSLVGPILQTLVNPATYHLDPVEGLGVVVPHRAQRAAMQQAFPELNVIEPITQLPGRSAIDTVERFQGGERTVIVVSATESDRGYLLASAGFLLDPRRLTVAVSRAKRKMILVASRSVFSLFSPDDETFANAQLWKNLLTESCTNQLWSGLHEGKSVTVWGGR